MRACAGQYDLVAVGLRLGDAVRADGAACAGDVLDDDLLAEIFGYRAGYEPCRLVGRPARRHEDRDDGGD